MTRVHKREYYLAYSTYLLKSRDLNESFYKQVRSTEY